MTALLLPAVLGTGGETGIAFTADRLLAIKCLGQSGKGRVVNSTTKAEDEV